MTHQEAPGHIAPPFTKRRVLLIEVDAPDPSWSSAEMTAALRVMVPVLNAEVWGEVGTSEVDGAYRKLRQLAVETESGDTQGNRVHSAHKALSFFREMFPTGYWQTKAIGR